MRGELEVIQTTEQELEQELQDGKKELARASKALTAAEKDAAAKNKQIEKISPKLSEARAKVKSLQRRITELTRNRAKVEKDLQQQQSSIRGLRGDISDLEEVEADLKEELDEANRGGGEAGGMRKLDAAGLKEYTQLREQVASRIATQRTNEVTIELNLKSKQEQLARLQKQDEASLKESEESEKLIATSAERLRNLKASLADTSAERQQLANDKEQLARQVRAARDKEDQLTAELEELTSKLREVGDSRRRGKQEERMNEAIASMQRIYKGVHGRLVDLCRPIQRKYSQAVSVAAGRQMDAVVVDSRTVAADCIRYLKDQRVGSCLFLPLDNISVKAIPERLRGLGRKYQPCVDLIECEEQFKAAVSYAVGTTLVCDTLEDARTLCFDRGERVQVVTLNGHSISKSGAMTGGATSRDGHDRWEETAVQRMRVRKAEIDEELAQLKRHQPSRQQSIDLESKIRACTSKMQYGEADIRVAEEAQIYQQEQRRLRGEAALKKRAEMEQLASEIKAVEKQLAQVHSSIQKVESEVFAAFSQRMGITNIREYEQTTVRKHESLMSKYNTVVKQKSELQSQLQYELKRDFKGTLERVSAQLGEAGDEKEAAEQHEQDLLQKEIAFRAELEALTGRLQEAREARDEVHASLKECQGRRSEVLRDKERVAKQIAGQEILIERGRAKLHDILQKAQVEEVALPTVQIASSSGGSGGRRRSSTAGAAAAAGGRRGKTDGTGSKESSSMDTSEEGDEEDEDDDDAELRWTGTQSQNRPRGSSQAKQAKGSSSSSSSSSSSEEGTGGGGSSHEDSSGGRITASTHFSQADNPVVVRCVVTPACVRVCVFCLLGSCKYDTLLLLHTFAMEFVLSLCI